MLLAVGIVALEFAAAVSRFVSSTLLPTVARDLHARDQLGLLVAGSTLGLFTALPLATRVVRRLGSRGTLTVGLFAYLGGLVVAATATAAWVYAVGQFAGGLASGLLAVFGIGSAIQHLDEALRVRVVAASSAMWILPALVGPAATLALEHLFGWRWTLLAPVPVVVFGRLLIVRAAPPDRDEPRPGRPLWRTLLVPVGVAALVLTSGHRSWWPLAAVGTLLALVGLVTIMPAGTMRLRPGTPASLGAMLGFATGYFGADSFITILLTDGYGASLARAAVVLSAAPLAWASTSLLVPRLRETGHEPSPAAGLALTAVAVAVLAATLVVSTAFGPALLAWTVAGVGVGLAYPGLYIRCTTLGPDGSGAAELATAVITAEAFGGLLGQAAGGAVVSLSALMGLSRTSGLTAAYAMFALSLFAAAIAATRTAARPAPLAR
jgi:predicted MFS family arabinose efflux permease